jgi:YVTN family beta-propeller protein
MRPSAVLALAIMSAFAADNGSTTKSWLLVANKGEHTLGLVDPTSGKQVAAVEEGGVTGHEVIASPDGRTAYVPIYGNSGVGKPGTDGTQIVAIDLATQKVSGAVDFGRGVRPHCPMFGPKNGLLYVSTELDQTISVIDPHTLKIVDKIPTGQPESHMFSITRDGKRAYSANVGPGTVSAIDLVGKKTIAVIPVAKQVQRMSISADDKYAFTSDVDAPRLAVIDTATNKVKQWIELPGPGYGSSVTNDNKWLVIAIPNKHQMAAIDLTTMKVAHTVDVPATPQETLVRPDQKAVYVSCNTTGKVAEIDIATWKVTRIIDAGKDADGLAWSGK